MVTLQVLREKLDLLIAKYNEKDAENKILSEQVVQHSRSIDALNAKIATLEQRLTEVTAINILNNEEEKKNIKLALDNAIAEIDKALASIVGE